jgi:hypothetical protein
VTRSPPFPPPESVQALQTDAVLPSRPRSKVLILYYISLLQAPWLVECHPEYDQKELNNQGVGRSKKLFPGQGFKEGISWPETRDPEVQTKHNLDLDTVLRDILGLRCCSGCARSKTSFPFRLTLLVRPLYALVHVTGKDIPTKTRNI